MSHFSKIKTKLKDLTIIKKTLTDLKYSYTEGQNLQIDGYGSRTLGVDLAVRIGSGYEVGLKWNEAAGSYDLIADWYGVRTKPEKLMQNIMQRYAYHKVSSEIQKQGLMISEESRLKDGSLKLVVRQWS
ncbi:MAG: hypothetical protein B6244_02515 [Candidatus Cloacimonetes bacterium 4572_55]|nr:MAG: hypothetical protein B6244_02515 [Candidatus Cloacimonetes bacterium 4572_55]